MAALFPTAIKSFTTRVTGDTIEVGHVNDLQDEVTALATAFVTGGTLAGAIVLTGVFTIQKDGSHYSIKNAAGTTIGLIGEANGGSFIQLTEGSTDIGAPAANKGSIYMRDNGSGKSQVVVRFATGAVQVLATEP